MSGYKANSSQGRSMLAIWGLQRVHLSDGIWFSIRMSALQCPAARNEGEETVIRPEPVSNDQRVIKAGPCRHCLHQELDCTLADPTKRYRINAAGTDAQVEYTGARGTEADKGGKATSEKGNHQAQGRGQAGPSKEGTGKATSPKAALEKIKSNLNVPPEPEDDSNSSDDSPDNPPHDVAEDHADDQPQEATSEQSLSPAPVLPAETAVNTLKRPSDNQPSPGSPGSDTEHTASRKRPYKQQKTASTDKRTALDSAPEYTGLSRSTTPLLTGTADSPTPSVTPATKQAEETRPQSPAPVTRPSVSEQSAANARPDSASRNAASKPAQVVAATAQQVDMNKRPAGKAQKGAKRVVTSKVIFGTGAGAHGASAGSRPSPGAANPAETRAANTSVSALNTASSVSDHAPANHRTHSNESRSPVQTPLSPSLTTPQAALTSTTTRSNNPTNLESGFAFSPPYRPAPNPADTQAAASYRQQRFIEMWSIIGQGIAEYHAKDVAQQLAFGMEQRTSGEAELKSQLDKALDQLREEKEKATQAVASKAKAEEAAEQMRKTIDELKADNAKQNKLLAITKQDLGAQLRAAKSATALAQEELAEKDAMLREWMDASTSALD